jgi:hypothetical protein
MRTAFTLLVVGTALTAGSAAAQTLNVRPAPLADLREGSQPRLGEVVLGRTTLAAALRMFAEELSVDSVKVPLAHVGNPAPIPAGTVWGAADHEVRPRHHLDLGPERYALYFDENERLIGASTSRLPGGLTWKVLSAHYSGFRKGRRWHRAGRPWADDWSVAVDRCVTLVAGVLIAGQRVETLSYHYTCPTTSTASSKAPSSR